MAKKVICLKKIGTILFSCGGRYLPYHTKQYEFYYQSEYLIHLIINYLKNLNYLELQKKKILIVD